MKVDNQVPTKFLLIKLSKKADHHHSARCLTCSQYQNPHRFFWLCQTNFYYYFYLLVAMKQEGHLPPYRKFLFRVLHFFDYRYELVKSLMQIGRASCRERV